MALDGLARSSQTVFAPAEPRSGRSARPLTIGLVNNMPDAALAATEAQFRRLIETASDVEPIALKLFSMPQIVRSDAARQSMRDVYASTQTLAASDVDALIVTGAEPLAEDLRQEPYWSELAALTDWARTNTVSTIWSCLAAHAAVLHLDQVKRRPLQSKCSGVFVVEKAIEHPLLTGRHSQWPVPHSRLNGLDEHELTSKGYVILSRGRDVGVDTFVKEETSLFVFFQGHPEYDPQSLMMEYRRDLRRFLRGEQATHPSAPQGYFDMQTHRALLALAEQSIANPRASQLLECSKIMSARPPKGRWVSATTQFYRNWIAMVRSQRDEIRLKSRQAS